MDLYEELRRMKILLIEDDPWTREALTLLFEIEGCRILALGSVAEGIDALVKDKFDLIICDYWLPDIDGLTFYRLYGSLQADAIRILITAYPTRKVVAEAEASGVHACIKKPFTGRFLEETLEPLIRMRKGTRNRPLEAEPVSTK